MVIALLYLLTVITNHQQSYPPNQPTLYTFSSGWANLPSSSWWRRRRGSTFLAGTKIIVPLWKLKTEILSTRGKRFFVELFHGRDGKVMKQEWVTIVQIVLSYKTSNCPGKRVGQSGWGLGDGGRQVQFLSQIDSNIETTLRGEEEEEEEVEEPSQQRRHQGRKNWVIFCKQLVHCQQSISIEYMQCRQTITLFNPLFLVLYLLGVSETLTAT